MYKGEINVPLEQLPSLLKAATALKIEGIDAIIIQLNQVNL